MWKNLTVLTVAVLLAATTGLLTAYTQPTATITLPEPGTAKELYAGCNMVALTFPNGTSSQAVVNAVSPVGSVQGIWSYDTAQQRFTAFSPAAPQASDLLSVNFLDAVWVCIAGAPAAPAPMAPTAAPPPPPAPTAPPSSRTTYMGTHSGGGTVTFEVSADGHHLLTFIAKGFCGFPDAILTVASVWISYTDQGHVFHWEEPYYDRYRGVSGIIYPSGEASGNINYHSAGCDWDGITWTAYLQQ
jgi:hypothetical protein